MEKKSSLLLKLSIIFGCVIILSNLILGVIAINSAANALETNTTRYMQETAVGNAKYLGSEIQVKLTTLEGVADNDIMRSMDWEARKPI